MPQNRINWAMVLFFAVFIVPGSVIGGLVFWLYGGVVLGALTSFEDMTNLAIGALAVSLVFSPLGMVQAGLTALVSARLSRRMSRTVQWLLSTMLVGGLLSMFSLPTALVAVVGARDFGLIGGAGFAMGGMFIAGALAAAVCAACCLKFRPRAKAVP